MPRWRCGELCIQPLLDLVGLHCHIGSQVADASLYGEAIRRMIAAMADVRTTHGVTLGELNIGGGHGVPYTAGDPELNLSELADVIDDALDAACAGGAFSPSADRGRAGARHLGAAPG